MKNSDLSIEYIGHISTRVPVAPSGQTPSYSNMAFQILGYLIEKQTGASFHEVVQKRIFNKLGLANTTIFAPKDSSKGVIPVSMEASGWSSNEEGDVA